MIQPWESPSVIHKLVPLAMQVRRVVGTAPGREYLEDITLGTILEVGWYLKIKYLTPFYRNFHFTCRTEDFYLIYSILNLLYFILRILAIRISHNYPFAFRLVQVSQEANTKMGADTQEILEGNLFGRIKARTQE